jgi:hypothetical protein
MRSPNLLIPWAVENNALVVPPVALVVVRSDPQAFPGLHSFFLAVADDDCLVLPPLVHWRLARRQVLLQPGLLDANASSGGDARLLLCRLLLLLLLLILLLLLTGSR